jgi:hypothetical protein
MALTKSDIIDRIYASTFSLESFDVVVFLLNWKARFYPRTKL